MAMGKNKNRFFSWLARGKKMVGWLDKHPLDRQSAHTHTHTQCGGTEDVNDDM